jgi:hypothetical protein
MVGCKVQGSAYLGAFGWLLVVNTCWLIRDGFFNSSELGGCLIYFNPISFTFIGCANNCIIKNLGVVYAIEKLCLSKVKACLTQVYNQSTNQPTHRSKCQPNHDLHNLQQSHVQS